MIDNRQTFDFMRDGPETGLDQPKFGQTRLATVINLRWIAVLGQGVTLAIVSKILGFEGVSLLAYILVASSAVLNIVLLFTLPSQRLISGWEIMLQQGWDIFQLGLLLSVTGGLSNPFLLLMLAPVTIGASLLSRKYAYSLAAFALIMAGMMPFWSYSLPWHGAGLDIPPIWEVGHFLAVATGVVFFSISASRVREDEAHLAQALDAARVVVEKERRMSALGALSAMTAHELGTPLATIHLVARELASQTEQGTELYEDANLIASQAERCRTILKKLSEAREADDVIHAHMPIAQLIEEAAAPHRGLGVDINCVSGAGLSWKNSTIRRAPEIIHALGAFIENAVSFAETEVIITTTKADGIIDIILEDDGPGFAKEVLPKLGEPYVTQRSEEHLGGGDMGLGFFIAKTLIERHNGRIITSNKVLPLTGAIIKISLPIAELSSDELDYTSQLT